MRTFRTANASWLRVALASVLLGAAAGCATVSGPEARAPRSVSVSGASEQDLLGHAPAAEVDAFAVRFGDHAAAGREACAVALAQDAPDLALALLERARRGGDEPTAAHVASALEAAGLADEARAEASGKRGSPDAAEPRCPAVVRTSRDARLALAAASRRRDAGDAAGASEAFGSAFRFARGSRDLGLALEVEAARGQLGVAVVPGVGPADLGSWLRHVAGLALDRKRPLVALRCALDAQTAGAPEDAFAARTLAARAQVSSGRASVALEVSLALAKDAHDQGDPASEATAVGVAGEALLALDRLGDAAGSFERAASLAREGGDSGAWARRSLNLARTQLRRGETQDARVVLETVERALPAQGRLVGRAALLRACLEASGEDYAAARGAVGRSLAAAAACGDAETVEQALALQRRLGNLGA